MFSKRRRAASNPAQRAPASASASLAATKAFVKDRESNSNLSNAAAAAALRSHTSSPTPVGDTITKRMVRRNSASSNGSSAVQPPGLHRQSSSGSMTERSFRNSSPGRGSPADPAAPPVPAVPKNISHRRASSLEPQLRGGSPAPRGGGRGVSLDRGTSSAAPTRTPRVMSNLSQVTEDDYDNAQRASVNFSRPMSPASAAKQSASPQSSKGWFGGPVVNQEAVQRMASTSRPKTSSSLASDHLLNTQQVVQNAAQRPVHSHQVSRGVEGTRLSSGSMRAQPSGTAVESRSYLAQPSARQTRGPVDPNSSDAIFDPSTRTFIHKQDAMARHRELHEEPEQVVDHYLGRNPIEQAPQPPTQVRYVQPRTPSPARRAAHHQNPGLAAQKREEVTLPRIDTSARTGRPDGPPIGYLKDEHDHLHEAAKQPSEELANADTLPIKNENAIGQPVDSLRTQEAHNVGSSKLATNQDSAYPRLPTPTIPTTTNTVSTEGLHSPRAVQDRGHSLSPPRNAHFAPVAVELAGAKHQPPPRSISPAKSALKASPSVSRRGSSPVAANGLSLSRGVPSDASDTTSERGGTRKKRDVRVSFEEAPVIASTSAYAEVDTPITPAGLGASKWSPTREKDNEFEDFMTPRPALPSFGSIRDKERRARQDDVPEKVTETVSSTPLSASVGSIADTTQSSNDHAIASIVAQDFASKHNHNDPLPPEVTTVEGTGYVSDSSDDVDGSPGIRKHGAVDDSSQILHVPEPKSLSVTHDEKPSTPASIKQQSIEVPEIALLPATPSPFEKPEPDFQPMSLPGGWEDEIGERKKDTAHPLVAIAEESQRPVPPTTLQELVAQDDDTSDDNSSIYSDAYEDLSDVEGGFGSIDAVMESPVVPSTSTLMFSRHADKDTSSKPGSTLRTNASADDELDSIPSPDQDWSMTKQHWSGLSESRKISQPTEATTEQSPSSPEPGKTDSDHRSGPSAIQLQTPDRPKTAQQSPKPLKSALKKTAASPVAQSTGATMKKTMRGPAMQPDREPNRETEPKLRSTMRAQPPRNEAASEPHLRKSMRGGPEASQGRSPQIRSTMRESGSVAHQPQGLSASRYSMPLADPKAPRGALQKRHIPASALGPRPQSMPTAPLKPVAATPTYDSDSDASASSFQRSRQTRNKGQRAMRSSMRSGPAPTMRSTAPAPVRSISPPGSPSPALRKSMRPSSPTPDVPKSSRFSIRSLSPMGRFRTSKPIEASPVTPPQSRKAAPLAKQPKQKPPAAARAKPAFKSRFADSSDEDDDDQPRHFKSRFADSDDDDETTDFQLPPGLTPVRGIPKKAGDEDGDSTDLEEEAEARPKEPGTARKGVGFSVETNGSTKEQTNGNTQRQGTALSSGSLRDSKHAPPLPAFESGGKAKSKRGFFGLGKKKPTPPLPGVDSSTNQSPFDAGSEIPMPPQSRIRTNDSALTPIDENKDIGSAVQTSPASKRSPKLQRRSTPEWPLPRNNIPVPPIPTDERPMSSDGITPRRPLFQKRQSSQMSNITTATAPVGVTSGNSISYGRGGKKKKFQGLRRVFGLND